MSKGTKWYSKLPSNFAANDKAFNVNYRILLGVLSLEASFIRNVLDLLQIEVEIIRTAFWNLYDFLRTRHDINDMFVLPLFIMTFRLVI